MDEDDRYMVKEWLKVNKNTPIANIAKKLRIDQSEIQEYKKYIDNEQKNRSVLDTCDQYLIGVWLDEKKTKAGISKKLKLPESLIKNYNPLLPGMFVIVKDLKKRKKLNGKQGKILKQLSEETFRIQLFDNGKEYDVYSKNLQFDALFSPRIKPTYLKLKTTTTTTTISNLSQQGIKLYFDSTTTQVTEWFKSKKDLSKYANEINSNDIDGMSLAQLTKDEAVDLEIKSNEHWDVIAKEVEMIMKRDIKASLCPQEHQLKYHKTTAKTFICKKCNKKMQGVLNRMFRCIPCQWICCDECWLNLDLGRKKIAYLNHKVKFVQQRLAEQEMQVSSSANEYDLVSAGRTQLEMKATRQELKKSKKNEEEHKKILNRIEKKYEEQLRLHQQICRLDKVIKSLEQDLQKAASIMDWITAGKIQTELEEKKEEKSNIMGEPVTLEEGYVSCEYVLKQAGLTKYKDNFRDWSDTLPTVDELRIMDPIDWEELIEDVEMSEEDAITFAKYLERSSAIPNE